MFNYTHAYLDICTRVYKEKTTVQDTTHNENMTYTQDTVKKK